MRYGLTVSTEPTSEPVTLSEAKAHLRVDSTDEDAYIAALVQAARQAVEGKIGRAIAEQTFQMSLDCFPSWEFGLPRPASSITSITYLDSAGDSQTLDSSKYRADLVALVPRVTPAYGEEWPATRPVTNAVTVTFVAGYGDADDVPEAIKQAIKIILGTYYDPVRAGVAIGVSVSVIPDAANYLLGGYVVGTMPGCGV